MESTIELFFAILTYYGSAVAVVVPVVNYIRKAREKTLLDHYELIERRSREARPHPEIPGAFYVAGRLVICS